MPKLNVVAGIIDKVADKIDEFTLDKAEKAQLMAEINKAQMEVNKVEAGSTSLFVSGWRPFVGWTCGVALCYHFVLQPFLAFVLFLPGVRLQVIIQRRLLGIRLLAQVARERPVAAVTAQMVDQGVAVRESARAHRAHVRLGTALVVLAAPVLCQLGAACEDLKAQAAFVLLLVTAGVVSWVITVGVVSCAELLI